MKRYPDVQFMVDDTGYWIGTIAEVHKKPHLWKVTKDGTQYDSLATFKDTAAAREFYDVMRFTWTKLGAVVEDAKERPA